MAQPDPEKLEKLQQALAAYERGERHGELFDRTREEALAPVRKRALGLLDQRARSREELRGRLVRAEFAPQVIEEVLDELERNGLINDANFAHEWVRQRAKRRGKSSRALDRELAQKGVGRADRADALAQLSEEDEEHTAREVAQKKARQVKRVPADRGEYNKLLRRVVGAMARRGFPEGMALAIGREVLEARLDELRED
ncbi:recombination regulator RecX [Corynebacterium sp. p3-SID1056]|uniref:recombination regulator RecX n=1 Tax=Corynebacterium sp. p3-SID1056 TaxID=2916092 RepID=UPI0021A3DD9C|nr:recombination regulator RecX [Corynebacterium sp. p3-SID1056]MCT2337772.1 recombination regulator RecX [Corynebacterium sp. p3-SID1056]